MIAVCMFFGCKTDAVRGRGDCVAGGASMDEWGEGWDEQRGGGLGWRVAYREL